MDAYVRLNDGILDVIKEQVDNEEVVNNLCMRGLRFNVYILGTTIDR